MAVIGYLPDVLCVQFRLWLSYGQIVDALGWNIMMLAGVMKTRTPHVSGAG